MTRPLAGAGVSRGLSTESNEPENEAGRTHNSGIPFNELNRLLDLGFKPLPWGDNGYLPSNLQQVGNNSNQAQPHQAAIGRES